MQNITSLDAAAALIPISQLHDEFTLLSDTRFLCELSWVHAKLRFPVTQCLLWDSFEYMSFVLLDLHVEFALSPGPEMAFAGFIALSDLACLVMKISVAR